MVDPALVYAAVTEVAAVEVEEVVEWDDGDQRALQIAWEPLMASVPHNLENSLVYACEIPETGAVLGVPGARGTHKEGVDGDGGVLVLAQHPDTEAFVFLNLLGSSLVEGLRSRLVWDGHVGDNSFSGGGVVEENVRAQAIGRNRLLHVQVLWDGQHETLEDGVVPLPQFGVQALRTWPSDSGWEWQRLQVASLTGFILFATVPTGNRLSRARRANLYSAKER